MATIVPERRWSGKDPACSEPKLDSQGFSLLPTCLNACEFSYGESSALARPASRFGWVAFGCAPVTNRVRQWRRFPAFIRSIRFTAC